MLALERQREILGVLEREGSARVTELAARLGVTEETIRRDLDKLEAEGKLQRSHGGAVSSSSDQVESPYWWRQVTHEKEKALIAREAALRVKEGDRILLDASSTAWHLARRLEDMPLTVVTNSIQAAMALVTRKHIQVISTGGTLSKPSLSFVGSVAERALEQYHVDRAFLSGAGVDPERGLTDAREEQAVVRRAMLSIADERILLADHSKFGVKAFAFIADLGAFQEVITDERTGPEFLQALAARGIKVKAVPV